ncbi:putative amino acid permease/transporter [Trypanosoma grayi]|uniref:putative amino acid permease/transporter n=1 Tax=Trypanosoma grayi TaxID=71804 RepID=UPI0004F3F25D|nr:putative amino acid permease/transporter [Trypanosoma grayi]KEG09280.1 putative amino acid permease/transporter [Trypanosoma grayi]
MQRQYFEQPRCHMLHRRNGTSSLNAEAPAANGVGNQSEERALSSHDADKEHRSKPLSPLLLLGLMYTYTICGAYAIEETVMGGGPLLALISIVLIPIFMAAPTAVVVAEMATAIPSNAAFLMWINVSFHRTVYFTMVILTLLLTFIDNALFPVLVSEYVCTSISCSDTGVKLLRAGMLLLTYILNLVGVQAVGMTSVLLSIITVSPFLLMFAMHLVNSGFYLNWPAISYIPSEIDWPTFITTASWNLCGLEQAAAVSEEIKAPHRTIILALVPLMGLAFLTYIPPILTGASVEKGPPDVEEWTTGYWAVVARNVGGQPLQVLMVVASVFSAFGQTLSALCTTTHIIAGMAYTDVFPGPVGRILYQRNKRFGTHHWALTVNTLITGIFSVLLDFGPLVKADQVLYGIRVVLIFLSFLIVRYRYPHLHRPFRVPLEGYQLGLFAVPILLFVALTIVAMLEDMQTVIINLSVLGGAVLVSVLYCFLWRKEDFDGRVVTETILEDQESQE